MATFIISAQSQQTRDCFHFHSWPRCMCLLLLCLIVLIIAALVVLAGKTWSRQIIILNPLQLRNKHIATRPNFTMLCDHAWISTLTNRLNTLWWTGGMLWRWISSSLGVYITTELQQLRVLQTIHISMSARLRDKVLGEIWKEELVYLGLSPDL